LGAYCLLKHQVKEDNVLIIQPLPGIGDIIWHLPHIKAIASNNNSGQVTLLTKKRSLARELLAGTSYVKEVIYLSDSENLYSRLLGGWRLGKFLKPFKFDHIWILHGSARYGIAAARAQIKHRFGYGIGWQDAFLTSPYTMTHNDNSLGTIEKATRCLQLNGVPFPTEKTYLELTKKALDSAKNQIKQKDKTLVGLAIGSSEPTKQWGWENFASLVGSIHKKYQPEIVLIGGPEDKDIANSLIAKLGHPKWIKTAIGLPILEAAAITSLCNICIGNDTGVLNIAAATGTISIGLFGSSPPQNKDPLIQPIMLSHITSYSQKNIQELTIDKIIDSMSSIPDFE
jgi:heptosyltransferase II